MSLTVILMIFVPAAVGGVGLLVAASALASYIVGIVRDSSEISEPSIPHKINNLLDFAKIAQSYVNMTGDNFRIALVYILSTIGAVAFVFSALAIIQALNLPK